MADMTMPPMDAAASGADLVVDRVTQIFGSGEDRLKALDEVSFAVPPGRFVGIVGPSGCGKSSLLMMMAGLARPSSGRILIRGKEIVKPEPRRVGVVFQEASLLPWKTAGENVAFPLKLAGMGVQERRAKAREVLRLVGLEGFENRLPGELSGGMRHRVSIARGFCQDPDILLMDEPFAALDEQTRMTLGNELLGIWETRRKTVAFVTHSLTEAVYLCDEVLVMSHRPGRILERIQIGLARPRNYDMMATALFGQLRDRIWRLIRHDPA